MDLTQEILEEKGFSVDEEGFKRRWKYSVPQREKARKVTNYMGADETVYESVDPSVTTEFVGYDSLNCKVKNYRTLPQRRRSLRHYLMERLEP